MEYFVIIAHIFCAHVLADSVPSVSLVMKLRIFSVLDYRVLNYPAPNLKEAVQL